MLVLSPTKMMYHVTELVMGKLRATNDVINDVRCGMFSNIDYSVANFHSNQPPSTIFDKRFAL